MTSSTPYNIRVEILGSFWQDYKRDPFFEDFLDYNDLGLPLAYAISSEIVESSPQAEMFINETFDLLVSALSLKDYGFETLDELLESGGIDTSP